MKYNITILSDNQISFFLLTLYINGYCLSVGLSGVGVQMSAPIVTKFSRTLKGQDASDIDLLKP